MNMPLFCLGNVGGNWLESNTSFTYSVDTYEVNKKRNLCRFSDAISIFSFQSNNFIKVKSIKAMPRSDNGAFISCVSEQLSDK